MLYNRGLEMLQEFIREYKMNIYDKGVENARYRVI